MTNESKGKERLLGAKLLIVVALAFAAALVFRRSAGILAMTPIALVLFAVAAFIDIGAVARCAVFGVTVFLVNTVENDDTSATIMFTALCLLAVAVFGYAADAIKKKKKHGFAVFGAGAVVSLVLCLVFVGNPFTAIKAKTLFDDYTERNYPNNEDAALGVFEFSQIYYRYDTKAFVIDAVSSEYPTEGASLTVANEVVRDGFRDLMEEKISEPYVADMASVLRKAFPDDSFTVSFYGFASLPDEAILSAEAGALADNVYYEITVGGIQTADAMTESVEKYINAIDTSGTGYAKIVFKSGIGNWQKRCITVNPNHPVFNPEIKLTYVNTASSNEFNEYLERIISYN